MKKHIIIAIASFMATTLGVMLGVLNVGEFNKKEWAILGDSLKWDYYHKSDTIKVDVPKYGTFYVPVEKTIFMPSDIYSVYLKWVEYDTAFFTKQEKRPIRLVITYEATPKHY